MSGFLYFLTNRTIPNLIKIGYTNTSLQDRLTQLNTTGLPIPFDVSASFIVNNPAETEKQIHIILDKYRFNKNREFFKTSTKKALEKSISVILADLSSNCKNSNSASKSIQPSHNLEDNTILLLKSLTGQMKSQGYDVFDLRDIINESDLETVNRLENLKEFGLVEEKKFRKEYKQNCWRITSKGVKFMFDHNLVEEYMLKSSWP